MEFITHSHRNAETIITGEPEFQSNWLEIQEAITSISDEILIDFFEKHGRGKSISTSVNELLKRNFQKLGWNVESPIFKNNKYNSQSYWRLDFAKETMSVEVAFNHSGSIAWNLLKPVLASELNHVEKAIQTKIGIIITATEEMKINGGYDNAIGTFERYVDYLLPLNNQLSVPLLIVGLLPPKSFKIKQIKDPNTKRFSGIVDRLEI